MITTTVKSNLS